MNAPDPRHEALRLAASTMRSDETTPNIVSRATAFLAFLDPRLVPETDTGAAQDTAPVSLRDEPPAGSVVVLRSPSTGALIVAQCRTYPNAEAAWYEFDRLAPYDWADLIAGRDVIAVHTPDVTS